MHLEHQKRNKIALISLPWATLGQPSLALGYLQAILNKINLPCDSFHFSRKFYEALIPYCHIKNLALAVNRFSGHSPTLRSEWIFSRLAFQKDDPLYAQHYLKQEPVELTNISMFKMRQIFEEIIIKISQMDWSAYKYIGFSCTFDQLISSLALSRLIKERYPDVIIMMGGEIFDEENAQEYIKKISWIDWIFVGEGEKTLPAAILTHQAGQSLVGQLGLVTKESNFCGLNTLTAEEFDNLPCPDFDEYYDKYPDPACIWELSRGCWYGDKNLCTFCGMVPLLRFKARSNVYETIRTLRDRYNLKHMSFADLINPKGIIESVFSKTSNLGMTFNITARIEIVAQTEVYKLKTLEKGGGKSVYFGIESLHPECLKLMRKGQLAINCISILKWCKFYRIKTDWSLLFGTPQEKTEYYYEMLELFPKLLHLSAPSSQPITFVRGSPYHKELKSLRVHPVYNYLYPADLDLPKIAEFFENTDVQLTLEKIQNYPAIHKLKEYIEYWCNMGDQTFLQFNGLSVIDGRNPMDIKKIQISQKEKTLLDFCAIPQKKHEIISKFNQEIIDRLSGFGFLLELDHRFLTLVEPEKEIEHDVPLHEEKDDSKKDLMESKSNVLAHALPLIPSMPPVRIAV
jgi:ribosomal peptide maturation radical SAM protein 1